MKDHNAHSAGGGDPACDDGATRPRNRPPSCCPVTLKHWLIVLVAALGEHAQIAVKVIDNRGNDLMVFKNPQEARG